MLSHPTSQTLNALGLGGMAKALEEQRAMQGIEELCFEERLALLIDREKLHRMNRRLTTRLKKAKLRHAACFEDIDLHSPRGLDKTLVMSLGSCSWVGKGYNVLITGATGVGKSFLACALAHKACLEGFDALYMRLPRLMEDLLIAKADGRYGKLMRSFAKTSLLVIDDWGLTPMTPATCRELLELLEDRHGRHSTIVTSQLPVAAWHEYLADATVADAILDRLVHNAYQLNLKGESMRKMKSIIDPN